MLSVRAAKKNNEPTPFAAAVTGRLKIVLNNKNIKVRYNTVKKIKHMISSTRDRYHNYKSRKSTTQGNKA